MLKINNIINIPIIQSIIQPFPNINKTHQTNDIDKNSKNENHHTIGMVELCQHQTNNHYQHIQTFKNQTNIINQFYHTNAPNIPTNIK